MKTWWLARNRSEQLMLGFCAVFVLLTAWYLVLVEPFSLEHERRITRLEAAISTSHDLANMAAEAQGLRSQGAAGTAMPAGTSLLSAINLSSGRAGTQGYTRRVNPLSDDSVALVLDDVPFKLLAGWLVELDIREGIAVERASIDRAAPGLADARLTLRARRAEQ